MDTNNWIPNQGSESALGTIDWRTQLHPDSRQRIVNKIMDTLKKHLPVSGNEGLQELQKIAQRFEDKIYTAATSQSDYLRKISMKMLTMETKSQNTIPNNMPSNEGGPSNNPPDQGLVLQSQVLNPGQQHPNPRQQLLPQTIQNHVATQPNLPSVSTLSQTPSQNISQNSNTQQPGQHSASNSIGQNSNIQGMFPGSQRQMPGRQQVVPSQQQQHQQPQSQQNPYQQQQIMKQKLSQMQQQQQQQSLLQPNQLNTSQQSVMQTSSSMQPSTMQSSLSSLPQNQQSSNVQQSTQSRFQQHSQIIRQQQQQNSIAQQQQTPMTQQSILPAQQQQQLGGPQSNVTNGQHAQMLGQQNNVGDTLKSQRLHPQQNNLMNPQQRQQQLINQQNNLTNIHQQQSGNNVPGLQQQQQFGTDSGNQGIQTSHHSAHILQQPKVSMQQQLQQNASKLLPSQSQQSQPQASQQQLMSQIHNQPAQMQQQMGLQQQPSSLQRDMQQKLQASGSLLQQQSILDQQKQLYQSQRALPETSTTSVDSTTQTTQPSGDDWQEEHYQKLQTMKERYMPDLNEIYQKIAMKLQQYDSTPQQPKSEHIEKLRAYKTMLERMITLLQHPKNNIVHFKEKLGAYEKQIESIINSFRPRKGISSLQSGQLPPTHMSSMPQSQSQVTSLQSHENQMISQMQPSNLQGSAATIQQNNAASLQHNSMAGLSTTQQNMMNTIQQSNNVDAGQGNSVNSLQQVPLNSLQQNNVSTSQQTKINSLSSQGGVNMIQSNLNTHQSGSTMLQPQLKHQEHQMLQNQQYKQQYQQQGQLMQRQQILPQRQQLHQPGKQQLSGQVQTHQMPQVNQMNDINDMKMRQGMSVKPGVFQQHITSGQNSAYSHQQSKQGSPFQVSSPQLFQAASPQISQHSSPQVDQQTHQQSLAKVGTPLQSSNSPFGVPTPSPPMAPSPMLVDSEKPIPGVSSSSAANVGQHTGGAAAPAQSLAIGTPGISASPLLAEFSGQDCAYFNASAATSGKSTADQPIDRLIRAVQSMSTETLAAAVNDISSVVSMSDRIAGSAPGNGSRAAVGEDLVSMTNCRLQARNFITQDGTNGIRKIKRYTSARPLNVKSPAGSKNDGIKQLSASEASQQESTATANVKKPKAEATHTLLEEIRQINRRLIDTVVDISDENVVDPTAAAVAADVGTEGTVVKCSFIPVALSPSLKSHYASLQYPIQPLRLLVPPNYPNCSPIFLDKFQVDSRNGNEDLSEKARSKFSMSLRNFPQPMSLKEIVKTWDVSARGVISEYAQQFGGGTFSSKYGSWKDILTA